MGREKFIQKRSCFQPRSRFVRAKTRWPDSHRALTTAFRWKRSFAFLGRTLTRPWPTTAPVTFLTMLYLPLTWPHARTTFNPDDILVGRLRSSTTFADRSISGSLSLSNRWIRALNLFFFLIYFKLRRNSFEKVLKRDALLGIGMREGMRGGNHLSSRFIREESERGVEAKQGWFWKRKRGIRRKGRGRESRWGVGPLFISARVTYYREWIGGRVSESTLHGYKGARLCFAIGNRFVTS